MALVLDGLAQAIWEDTLTGSHCRPEPPGRDAGRVTQGLPCAWPWERDLQTQLSHLPLGRVNLQGAWSHSTWGWAFTATSCPIFGSLEREKRSWDRKEEN